MKTQSIKKRILRTLVSVVFWCIIIVIFLRNSFIRPYCFGQEYKELMSVGIIIAAVYANKLIFIPKLFLKNKFGLFALAVIMLVLLSGFMETLLVKSNIAEPGDPGLYLPFIFVVLSGRNALFVSFSFILTIYKHLKDKTIKKEQLVAETHHHITFTLFGGKETILPLKDICAIQTHNGLLNIYLSNGNVLSSTETLTHCLEIIPKEMRTRVNRFTIVFYKYVQSFNTTKVHVKIGNKKVLFEISHHYQQAYTDLLKNVEELQDIISEDECAVDLERLTPILDEIIKNPHISFEDLHNAFPLITTRTLQRYIQQLKTNELIYYQGSSRKGGYVAINSKDTPNQ